MTAQLDRITDAAAEKAYRVRESGIDLGSVALTTHQRPTGASLRRVWRATPPADDPLPIHTQFDTRSAAISALRYRYARRTRPAPAKPADVSLALIESARESAGPAAALWLAASLTVHHVNTLHENRQANPPALWRELERIISWLRTAIDPQNPALPTANVDYRQTFRHS
jgi:hypothetical protein